MLDSAYCCHSHRKDFLSLLVSDEYFIKEQATVDIGPSRNRSASTMLKRFGEKMRSVELVDSRRFGSEKPNLLVVAHCHNLTHLTFSCTEVCTPKLWALLKTNPHIECLTILNSNDDGPFNSSFDDIVLPKLTTLVVKDYDLSCKSIVGAMKMKNVVRLDLSACDFAENVLLKTATLCPQLRAAVLSNLFTQGLTDELLSKLTVLCPHIVHLDISNADWVTDAGMLSVVQNLKGLQTLRFSDVSQLTETSLVYIYTHCADTLRTFVFSYNGFDNTRFSAYAINTLLERCTKLRTVYLNDKCKGTSPFVFNPAAVHNLTTLAIGCDIVSDENFAIIRTHAANLQVLEIDSQYVHYTLVDLVNSCPRLTKIHFNLSSQCDANRRIPNILTPAYWKNIRPGVLVSLSNEWKSHWKPTKPEAFDF